MEKNYHLMLETVANRRTEIMSNTLQLLSKIQEKYCSMEWMAQCWEFIPGKVSSERRDTFSKEVVSQRASKRLTVKIQIFRVNLATNIFKI